MGFQALRQAKNKVENFQVFHNGQLTEKVFQKTSRQSMVAIWKTFDKYANSKGFNIRCSWANAAWANANDEIIELKMA